MSIVHVSFAPLRTHCSLVLSLYHLTLTWSKFFFNRFPPKISVTLSNSLYCLPTNYCDVSSENLVLYYLLKPSTDISFCTRHLFAQYCMDIVRSNSVLVTCGSSRVNTNQKHFVNHSFSPQFHPSLTLQLCELFIMCTFDFTACKIYQYS